MVSHKGRLVTQYEHLLYLGFPTFLFNNITNMDERNEIIRDYRSCDEWNKLPTSLYSADTNSLWNKIITLPETRDEIRLQTKDTTGCGLCKKCGSSLRVKYHVKTCYRKCRKKIPFGKVCGICEG